MTIHGEALKYPLRGSYLLSSHFFPIFIHLSLQKQKYEPLRRYSKTLDNQGFPVNFYIISYFVKI